MKTRPPTKAAAPELTAQVARARQRLVNAEIKLATARQQLELARQRRKEAKRAARQAKKVARQAKELVTRAKGSLARFEARLAQAHPIPVKTRSRAKTAAATPRRKRRLAPVKRPPPTALKIKPARSRRTKLEPVAPSIGETPETFQAASPEFETPLEMLPPSEHKPTPQIVKGVEEIFTEEADSLIGAAPTVESVDLPESPANQPTKDTQDTP